MLKILKDKVEKFYDKNETIIIFVFLLMIGGGLGYAQFKNSIALAKECDKIGAFYIRNHGCVNKTIEE